MSTSVFTVNSNSDVSLGVPVFTLLPTMWHSWLEFVHADRIIDGQHKQLGLKRKGRCKCGKGAISYPHWPVSTINEAFDMLNYLHDEHNKHRRYLAHKWWAFERAKPDTAEQRRPNMADDIIKEFKCISIDINKDTKTTPRARGWKCSEYCEVVLSNNESICLCHCYEHRDECPIHKCT
jgi:hypothetical protein